MTRRASITCNFDPILTGEGGFDGVSGFMVQYLRSAASRDADL